MEQQEFSDLTWPESIPEHMRFKQMSAENESDISTEILIMLGLLILAITAGQFLKKSGHKYL